jgi:hypothetical protein
MFSLLQAGKVLGMLGIYDFQNVGKRIHKTSIISYYVIKAGFLLQKQRFMKLVEDNEKNEKDMTNEYLSFVQEVLNNIHTKVDIKYICDNNYMKRTMRMSIMNPEKRNNPFTHKYDKSSYPPLGRITKCHRGYN